MFKKYDIRMTFVFLFIGCFAVLIFVSPGLTGSPVYAVDGLYLTGILKDVDVNTRTIVVDVKSQNCPGLRTFIFDDASRLQGLEGKMVSFSIDSSVCKDRTIYKVVSIIRHGG